MHIKYFMPRWGSEHLSYDSFFEKVKIAGFDGVEMTIPTEAKLKNEILQLLSQYQLALIAQQGESHIEYDIDLHIASFESYIRNAADVNPLFINSQTGKDIFPFEQNCRIIDKAHELESELEIPVIHEIHRGKFTFAPILMKAYLDTYPQLKLGADLSHWLTVSESNLTDPLHKKLLNSVLPNCKHIHARIGFEEGPQVNDPRAPEWQSLVNQYILWWQTILDIARNSGEKTFTITPEFGPYPYMPQLPYTQMDIANPWEINVYMKNKLKEIIK